MKATAAVALLLLGGCTWSNSLYQARRSSAEALAFERENRPGDAENAWGVAASKAESAYVRAPASEKAPEALWLQGRALSRIRSCVTAAPALERSLLLRRDAPWRESLLFELATCREILADRGALALFEELASSRDTTIRRIASSRAGESLLREGRWLEALTLLQGLDGPLARLRRATALTALDRLDEAMTEVGALTLADSSLDFVPLLTLLSSRSTPRTDQLLATLTASRLSTAERQGRWLLAAAQGSALKDPTTSDRYLARLVTLPRSQAFNTGALLATDRILARATSPADLRTRLDSLTGFVDEGISRLRADQLKRSASALLDEEAATKAGSDQGDLVLFVLAETARDSFAAPVLAGWLFGRVERDWPRSPYVAKSLLARLPLLPDSGDVLRARLAGLPPGPYLSYLRGVPDAGFARLEDSLRVFILDRARIASGRRAAAPRDATPP